jgi:cobalamin synthase
VEETIQTIYSDPVIGKLIIALLGIIIITTGVGLLKKSLLRYIKDQENWYKTKKAFNVVSYLLVIIFIMVIYSDKLGWITIMVSGIFKTGDRVKLGGVTGDVIGL